MNIDTKPQRARRTKAQMDALRAGLLHILKLDQPMTLRQVFYRATVDHLVEKTEQAYDRIGDMILQMRRDGTIPYSWVLDNTRAATVYCGYSGLDEFLGSIKYRYSRDLWADLDEYCEIWIEKDALSSIVAAVTRRYDVTLQVCRGFPSESCLHDAATRITEQLKSGKTMAAIYYLGDRDPSGLEIDKSTEASLRRLCRGLMPGRAALIADIPALADPTVPWPEGATGIEFREDMLTFTRAAVTPKQIREMALPSRPTKLKGNSHARGWNPDEDSVELDAIAPRQLQAIVEGCILEHIDEGHIRRVKEIEATERELIATLAGGISG